MSDELDIVRLGREIAGAASVIRDLSDPARMSDVERRAHEQRVGRLLDSDEVAAALGTIVSTPDIWADVAPVVARKSTFQTNSQGTGQHHRDLAPLLAGVLLNDRATALFRLGL